MHVAIYARISRDQEGRREGVATQEAHGRRYATGHWPDLPVVAYSDNDLSASNGDQRAGYDALIAAVRRGDVAQVVCAEQSRLTRQPAQWEALLVTLAKAGIDQVHTYRKGTVAVRGSKMVGRIMAAVDAEESERIKARVQERHAALRAEGRPRGGVEYGYRPGRNRAGEATLEVEPGEAGTVRWCAESLLSGWSLAAVARDLNQRGVPTLHGRLWGATTVRRMISKPTVAGRRTVGTRGTWQPVLDEQTWRDVRSLLDGRAATKARARRRFLLTGGVATCGRCGGRLGAQQRKGGPRSILAARYFCKPYEGQCQKVSISADPLEAHVTTALLDELDRPEFLAAFTADSHETERARLAGELHGVELRRSELARLVAAGDMSTAEWREARGVLDADQARLSAALVEIPRPLVDVDPQVIREGWQAMTLDEQRTLIDMFIDRVVVSPAVPGTRRFDPGRVTIEWRRL